MPNLSREAVWFGLVAVVLAACARSAPPAREPGAAPSGSSPALPLALALAPSGFGAGEGEHVGAYEVHEWGVIDVPLVGAVEVGAGPGAPSVEVDEPRPMKKPILYFHLDPGASALEVDVTARIPRGSVLEVWPAGQLTGGGSQVRWPKVRVGACPRPALSFAFPSERVRASGWASADGFNEVFDLPAYEASDSACLHAGETAARLLFYRGSISRLRLPIEMGRDEGGRAVLRSNVAGTGAVLRMFPGGRGIAMPWPAAGATAPLSEKIEESLDPRSLAQTLEHEILARGLSPGEARAFMNAWRVPFFGTTASLQGHGPKTHATCAPAPEGPAASIIYLMPDSTVSSAAELRFDPPPRVLKRVMVVRLALPDLASNFVVDPASKVQAARDQSAASLCARPLRLCFFLGSRTWM